MVRLLIRAANCTDPYMKKWLYGDGLYKLLDYLQLDSLLDLSLSYQTELQWPNGKVGFWIRNSNISWLLGRMSASAYNHFQILGFKIVFDINGVLEDQSFKSR